MQNDTFNSTTTNITTTATDTTTQASYSSSNAFGYSNTMKTADQALTTIFTFLFILLFIISIVLLAFKKRLYTNGWYPSITSTMYWFTLVHAGCMYYLLSITRSYLRIFSAIQRTKGLSLVLGNHNSSHNYSSNWRASSRCNYYPIYYSLHMQRTSYPRVSKAKGHPSS